MLKDGCRFCLLLCQALNKSLGGWRKSKQGSVSVEIEEGKPVVLRFEDEVLQIYAPQSPTNNLPWIGIGAAVEVPSRTDSDESYEFINKCLRSCLTHEVCNSITLKTFPTRVLDVGKSEQDPIRIHAPRNYGFQYVALSKSLYARFLFYC